MDDFQLIFLFLGAYGLVTAIGLALVKVDKNSLDKVRYLFPLMTLCRYPAFRWSMVVLGTGFTLFCFALAFGVVDYRSWP